jgi:hypothetical protein
VVVGQQYDPPPPDIEIMAARKKRNATDEELRRSTEFPVGLDIKRALESMELLPQSTSLGVIK